MSGAVRCFVSVELPEQLREAVAGHFAGAGRGLRGVAWVRAANLHLTLKFLGELDPAAVEAVRAALPAAVAASPPFTLELRGAGAFPAAARPRVLFVGAGAGAAELTALAAAVERELAPLGRAPEGRPFAPHLTVGRVKAAPADSGALRRLLDAARDRVFGSWLVPAAHLVRSELFPAGPIYSILQTIRLPPGGGAEEGARSDG